MIIIRQDNFLSKIECDNFIKIIESSDKVQKLDSDGRYLLTYKDDQILFKLASLYKVYNFTPMNIDNMEINRWPSGTEQKPHYDKNDKFAFVVFLNEDFSGGETVVDDIILRPKIGRLILFNNGITGFKHQVKKIEGVRYTLIGWFK